MKRYDVKRHRKNPTLYVADPKKNQADIIKKFGAEYSKNV